MNKDWRLDRAIARPIITVLLVCCAATSLTRQRSSTQSDQETIRLSSTLVQVPALVTDSAGRFVGDLSKSDFSLFEDGKPQQLSLFSQTKQPFNAVLVIDTSNSSRERLTVIQDCAVRFSRQVSADDRMMVISFDNEVKTLTEFTNDRTELESAIKGTESGFGKLLYEAVDRALDQLAEVQGRRAVVLFTDGVDMRSIEASFEGTIRKAEHVGAVIYCVKFDTRWWTEAEARKLESERQTSKTPIQIDGRIPLPPDFGGPEVNEPGIPKAQKPRIEIGRDSQPPVVLSDSGGVHSQRTLPGDSKPDPVAASLDKLYGEADSYLQTLSATTGGRVFLAENLERTRSAFELIADELRNQYLIGYYPSGNRSDGKYHKIKLEVARKGLQVRARQGYRGESKD
jgi:VWFA-related protein